MVLDGLPEVLAQQKKRYGLLCQVMELTGQLEDAVGRDDKVSITMLLAMRREPVLQLSQLERELGLLSQCAEPQVVGRLKALCGGEPAQVPEEEPLAQQVAQNFRLLERIVKADELINRRLGGPHSYYLTKETPQP